MGVADKLNIGVVGIRGRGAELARIASRVDGARVHALCDVVPEGLDELAAQVGCEHQFARYEEFLSCPDLDAVIVATPMPLHVPQAVAALRQGYHVLSEVPAAVSVDECRELAVACREARRVYSMAENFVFYRPNVLIGELVRQGLFGTVYHASADYWDEYKANNEKTPWRRRWQTGINGVTYGTHSLGPLLSWMPGDRIVAVSCVGSGHHHRDPRGDYYENEDAAVMLGRMQSGGLIVLRHDMTSDRPHAPFVNGLQGTDGCYESSRVLSSGELVERNRVWLRSRSADMETWLDLETLADEFLPQAYREAESAQGKGSFYSHFPITDFVEAIVQGRAPRIGIDEALDMTLPGLVSQQSIQEGGCWVAVPDSRNW